ncbi:hypothetical protein HUJ05_009585 [Dendroctonus ponderosae]|nr:hypothetical protein HUJ05_013355 [Dendroctonus ponderosae]KAH0999307.1 hypothetical protein HUJ05_009585 [Dendroctonus ponderosae]
MAVPMDGWMDGSGSSSSSSSSTSISAREMDWKYQAREGCHEVDTFVHTKPTFRPQIRNHHGKLESFTRVPLRIVADSLRKWAEFPAALDVDQSEGAWKWKELRAFSISTAQTRPQGEEHGHIFAENLFSMPVWTWTRVRARGIGRTLNHFNIHSPNSSSSRALVGGEHEAFLPQVRTEMGAVFSFKAKSNSSTPLSNSSTPLYGESKSLPCGTDLHLNSSGESKSPRDLRGSPPNAKSNSSTPSTNSMLPRRGVLKSTLSNVLGVASK